MDESPGLQDGTGAGARETTAAVDGKRRRRWRRRLGWWGASVAALYGVAAMIGLRGLLESRLFYFPNRDPFLRAPTAEEAWFTTPDGLRLHGWFFAAEGASRERPGPAVVHAHGNAGSINWHTEFSSFLPREGVSVFLFDSRGFGKSDLPKRRLCRDDLVKDTLTALEYVRGRADVDPARVGVYGVSLGGVIGLAAAAEDPAVRAVVSIAAFATWRGVAADHGGRMAARLIPAGREAADAIAGLGERPLLIVHGERDEIVPVAHAQRLKEAADRAGVRADVIIDAEGDHNSIVYTSRELQGRVAEWLRAALSPRP